MAPKKATAKSPKPKSTPRSQAKPEVVEVSSDASSNYDDVPDLDAEEAQDYVGSGDDSGPEPEAAATTPARKGGKRKAAGGDKDESPGAKKPRVSSSSVRISETVTESGGKKKHAHRNVKVEIPVSATTTPATKPAGKHIVFNDDDGPAEFFTPQEAPAQELLDAQLSEAGRGGGAGEGDEDEEGSDSDDDAPEAVSSYAAAAQAAKSAQAATKAAEK